MRLGQKKRAEKKDILLDKERKKREKERRKRKRIRKKKWQEMSFSLKSLVTFSVEVAFE